MNLNYLTSSRRVPDLLMEELVAALLCSKTIEFKSLFSLIHTALKEKKVSGGGEEMLRLRTYDKLQSLVRDGNVTKVQGRYKGIRKQLLLVAEKLQERRLPRPHLPASLPPETQTARTTARPPKNSRRPQ